MGADSFQGGVDAGRAGRGELRARVAVQGSNIEALTGDEAFRIPIARCSLARDKNKILVRDEQGSLVIWSDDEGFLDALEKAQRGTLKDQVGRIRRADRRRRRIVLLGKALIAAAALFALSVPVTRWAVRGGVPIIADWIGESALEHLDLPSGVAPAVERRLALVAEQLRPASSLPGQSFRVLLAGYADVHSFSIPPDVIVVTTGLVCGAEDPSLVTEAVAIELAHLESRDVHQRVAEAVDWHTPIDLALGDAGALRERMLDFADPKRSPGFTPAQASAAKERALAMLAREGAQPLPTAGKEETLDWPSVRAEACDVIGR